MWLLAVILVLQIGSSGATSEEEAEVEPVSLELSLMMVLMTMSILFVWESARKCVSVCCSRRQDDDIRDEPRVRVVDGGTDEDLHNARRGRRQNAVRRAIERELQGEGVRQRVISQGTAEQPDEGSTAEPRVSSYVHVQVDSAPQRPVDFQPPMPTFVSSPPSVGLLSTGLGRATSSLSSTHPEPDETVRARPDSGGGLGETRGVTRDASTQTAEHPGFNFQELCELHVTTSTGRGPGALHLFPNCHALRNVSSTHQRMFCRYCLQAARERNR